MEIKRLKYHVEEEKVSDRLAEFLKEIPNWESRIGIPITLTVLTGSAGIELLQKECEQGVAERNVTTYTFEDSEGKRFKVELNYSSSMDSQLIDNRTYRGYTYLSYKILVSYAGEFIGSIEPIFPKNNKN